MNLVDQEEIAAWPAWPGWPVDDYSDEDIQNVIGDNVVRVLSEMW
jgi:hypothetical protein